MRSSHSAVIELKDPIIPAIKAMIESVLHVARGVSDVRILPESAGQGRPRILLSFDSTQTALGDIVETMERHGWPVRMVAQHRLT